MRGLAVKQQADMLADSRRADSYVNITSGGGSSAKDLLAEAETLGLSGQASQTSYVVARVAAGREHAACQRIMRMGCVADVFPLERMALWRANGMWELRREPVWPGYVLVEPRYSLEQEDLDALRSVGTLNPAESALIARLAGPDHVIGASQGVIEHGQLRVDFGPLAGLEKLVQRIDRHRRMAWLAIEPGQGRRLAVALEVTSKS